MEGLVILDNKSDINTVEKTLGNMISSFIDIGLQMSEEVLSNIEVNNCDKYCSCGKKLINTKREAQMRILSMYGYIPVKRDALFCRRCSKGYGISDEQFQISANHRIKKGITGVITYVSQLMPFKEASETIKRLINVEVNPTQMHIVSEEIGQQIFENSQLYLRNS